MNVKKINYILRMICIFIAISIAFTFTDSRDSDTIKYEGKKYVPLKYSMDIFYYDYNGDSYVEEDEKYPVKGAQWDMLYYNGDMYCSEDEQVLAKDYYANDANYDWFVTVTDDDYNDTTYPITVTEDEIAYLNTIENMPKDTAIFFEEIEIAATLSKVSKDGIIKGVTELAYYNSGWYWRSEIIDESREKDGTWPEYVYVLPKTLSDKIGAR